MKIFIIIPAFNEADKLGGVVSDLLANGYKNLVVVDDCSTDDTYQVARHYPIKVLRHVINRGQGAALGTGNAYALSQGAEILVHFDADGQMLAREIKKLLAPFAAGRADIVLGSRFMQANNKLPWLKRYVYFPIGKVVNLIFTGLWLTDAHCGFRALSRQAAQRLNIRQDRMAHASEILEKINIYKLKYQEVPVVINYENFGQGLMGVNGAIKTVRDLLKAKFFK